MDGGQRWIGWSGPRVEALGERTIALLFHFSFFPRELETVDLLVGMHNSKADFMQALHPKIVLNCSKYLYLHVTDAEGKRQAAGWWKSQCWQCPSLSSSGGCIHCSALLLTLSAFLGFPCALQKSWCSKINCSHQTGTFSTFISIPKVPMNWLVMLILLTAEKKG